MRWLLSDLCSATAGLSGCPSRMCRLCSFILVSIDLPVCPMYTWTHSQGMPVYPRSSKSQVVLYMTKETGDLPRRQANSFNVEFSQHSAGSAICRPDIRKKSNRGGLLLRLIGSNRQNKGPSYLIRIIPIFPERCLEEIQLLMEVVTHSPGSVHQG